MSHFPVLVFTNGEATYEELLERYDENMEVEKYISYTKEEAIEEGKRRVENIREFLRKNPGKEMPHFNDDDYKTDEDYYQFVESDYPEEFKDEEGNLYSTYNRDAKWDWYVEGGRFSGTLKNKAGEYVTSAPLSEIKISRDESAYEKALRFWGVAVEGKPMEKGENFFSLYKPEYYIDRYKCKEVYAYIVSHPIFRACVTPDGVWHEKGQMGWWACSSETGEESLRWDLNFIDDYLLTGIENNWYVTVVDCHI